MTVVQSPASNESAAAAPPADSIPMPVATEPPRAADPAYLPPLIWTPEVERCTAQAIEWVVSDMPGGTFIGLPLTGKSHFLLYCKKVLPLMLGGSVSHTLWSFMGFLNWNKEDVLRLMMFQSGCRAVHARSYVVLFSRLVDHLLETAQAFGARRFVAFIDEIQELPEPMYQVIRSVTAKVQEEGLCTCTVSVGQVSLSEQVDHLYREGNLRVAGRFFGEAQPFNALTVEEAIAVLANLEGPSRDFTARWFPRLHANGWSLEQIAPHLRRSVLQMSGERGLTREALLPLNYFRPALVRMLRILSARSDRDDGLSEAEVHACLAHQSYARVMHHYVKVSEA